MDKKMNLTNSVGEKVSIEFNEDKSKLIVQLHMEYITLDFHEADTFIEELDSFKCNLITKKKK